MISASYKKERLGGKVFKTLRDRIVYLDYPPGSVVTEKQLCQEFQVSRTPVREAILRLESMNLVESVPRFGTRVTNIDTLEIRNTYEVKIGLEHQAGYLAAQRISDEELAELKRIAELLTVRFDQGDVRQMFNCDFEFHDLIWRASDNPVLADILRGLHPRCLRMCIVTLPSTFWTKGHVLEIETIYRALADRDPDRSAHLMKEHNQQFLTMLGNDLFSINTR
jgi:DNA-binding GntR family transcriptional regulator